MSTYEKPFRNFKEQDYGIYLHRALELYPFFSQSLLIPAMAVERWLLICRPIQASVVLKSRYKYSFYITIALVCLVVPTIFFSDFIWFQTHPVPVKKVYINLQTVYIDGVAHSFIEGGEHDIFREVI